MKFKEVISNFIKRHKHNPLIANLVCLYNPTYGLYLKRRIKGLKKQNLNEYKKEEFQSELEVDVLITCLEKDFRILPLCIEGLKKNFLHNIKKIYLICPKQSKKIIDFCKKNSDICEFLDEDSIFEKPHKKMGIQRRSGWIYQQLIKLNGNIGECDYYFTIDADTVLINPDIFIKEETKEPIFIESGPLMWKSVAKVFNKTFGYNPKLTPSFIIHKMLFDKKKIKEFHKDIEDYANNEKTWYQILIENINSLSTEEAEDGKIFSEFDFYVKWHDLKKYAYHIVCHQNISSNKYISSYDLILKEYKTQCKSVSFHNYRLEN